MITEGRFIEDIKNYFEEANKYDYPQFVRDMDLQRMVSLYTQDVEEYTREETAADYKYRLQEAYSQVEDALDYLEVD